MKKKWFSVFTAFLSALIIVSRGDNLTMNLLYLSYFPTCIKV